MKTKSTLLAAAFAILALSATVPGAVAQESEPVCLEIIDVSLVMDRSGSMGGSRIATAISGADHLVSLLSPSDRSALVSYASTHTLDKSIGTGGHAQTQAAINAMTAGGGTNAPPAITAAHQDLINNNRGVHQILIHLTDGHTAGDPVAAANAAKADGIEVYVIGIGSNVNTAQLQAQASTPVQDHYFNPQTNQELEAIFDHLATTIGGAAAKANSYAFWAGANSVATNTQAGTNYVNQKLYPTGGEEAVLHEYVFSNGVQATFTEIYNKADGSEATAFVSASALSRIASVTIQGPPAAPFLVQAKGLQASAGSHATPQSASASTVGSYMESVSINSIPIQGTVPPNTNISLGGNSFVVLNEQFTSAGSSSSLARANSLHLYVELAAGETFELIVSHADVATVCMDEEEPPGECVPSATNPCCDISSTKGLLAQATECVECDLSAKGCVECPPPTTLADPCNPCPGIRIGSPTEISISPQDCVPECPPELIECGSPCDNVSTCEVVCAFVSATGERVRDIHPTVGNAVAKLDCRLIEQISAN